MYLNIGRVRVHITFPFALFTAFIFNSAAGETLAVSFVSALLHETVHLIFLIGYGFNGICLTLNPGGAAIKCGSVQLLDTKRSLFTFLSAPAVNLILSLSLFFVCRSYPSQRLFVAARVNFYLGAVNLLPLTFLDGGRALNSVLSMKSSIARAKKISEKTGYLCLAFLTVFTLILFVTGKNATGLAIFTAYCIVYYLFVEKNSNLW